MVDTGSRFLVINNYAKIPTRERERESLKGVVVFFDYFCAVIRDCTSGITPGRSRNLIALWACTCFHSSPAMSPTYHSNKTGTFHTRKGREKLK